MEKRFSLGLAVLFCVVMSFLALNCDTGLGSAVDVQKPSVSITYPPANAAICDEFVLAGTCSDDQGVAEIAVTIYKNGSLFEGSGPYKAEIADDPQKAWKEGRQWKLTLNHGTDKTDAMPPLVPAKDYPLKDGTYTIQVQGVDTSGRVSDIDSRSFIIDNTPPVLILNKPMATGKEKPTSYGRILKLAGDANDAQNYNLSLYLKQYEGNADNTLPSDVYVQDIKIEDINVSGMSSDNPLVIAQYYDPKKINGDEDKTARTEIYERIYGTVNEKNINKFYYAGIRLRDKAKVYQNPNETSNETTGNETDVYFINNDNLRTVLTNIGTDGVKAQDITAVLSGTDTYDEATRKKIKDALSEPGNFVKCSSPEDVSTESNIFRLNPDNNPTWSIANYTIKPGDSDTKDGSGYRDYNLGAAHTLTITPNTDGDYVVPKNIKLYYQQYVKDASNNWKVKNGAPKIYLINPDPKPEDTLNDTLFEFDDDSSNEAVTKGGLIIEGLGANEYYKFGLEGTDFNENDYAPVQDEGYGFRVAISEIAPNVKVTEKPDEYFKQSDIVSASETADGGIIIKGTIIESSKKLGYKSLNPSAEDPNLAPIDIQVSCVGLEGDQAPKAYITLTAKDKDKTDTFSWMSGDFANVPAGIFECESKDWEWSVKIFSTDSFAAEEDKKNYSYTVNITVSNSLALSSEPIELEFVGDNAAPSLRFTNKEFFVNGKDGTKNTKPVILETSTTIEENTKRFTMNGAWSDKGGSSPTELYYWYGTGEIPAKNSNDWTFVNESGNNKTETQWFIQTEQISESEGNKFAVWAKDGVGNETEIEVVGNVMFDFAVPKVTFNTCETVDITKKELNTKNTSLTVSGSVTDTYKFSATPIEFTVKKNGGQVTDADIVTTGSTKDAGYPSDLGEKYNWSVTLKAGDDHATEGKWTIDIKATDAAGRSTSVASETINIDTTAPVILTEGAQIGGKDPSETIWHNTTTPKLKFSVKEAGGIDKIYYWKFKNGVTKTEAALKALSLDDATGSYAISGEEDIWTLNANAQSFDEDGKYWIYLRAVDNVGNESVETNTWPVNIDTTDPYLSSNTLKEVQTNGDADVSVTIEAYDESSGVNKVVFKLKRDGETDVEITPVVNNNKYTATVTTTYLTKNGAVWATAYDNVERKTKDTKVLDITVDKTAPKFTITSVGEGETLITEETTKCISQSGNDYTFTLEGKWSDVGGVGADSLYYSETSAENWATQISEETALKIENAPEAQSEEKPWSKSFTIKKGDQSIHNYYLRAYDKVGNASDVQSRTGIKFDFEKPKLTASGAPVKQADKDIAMTNLASPLTVTITASDDRKLAATPVAFTIKKDGKEQSLVSASDPEIDAANSTAVYKIVFNKTDGTLDGTWTIDATVTDDAGRTGSLAQIKFLVDTTKPVIKAGGTLGGKALTTEAINENWISITDTPKLSVSYTEAGSGIEKLYYFVKNDTEGSFSMSKSGDDWVLTGSELKKISPQGKYQIQIWAEDNAGNQSDKTNYQLWVDTDAPTLEYSGWKNAGDADLNSTSEFNTRIASDIIVGINAKDSVSQLKKVDFKIESGSAAAETLDVTDLTGGNYQISKEKFKEGKNIIYATAYDNAGLNSGEKELCTITVDTTKPVVSITTVGEDETLITEKSVSSITSSSNEKQYQFTLGGKWSDIGGVGTDILYYSEISDENWATQISEGIAKKAGVAVTSSAAETAWSHTFTIDVGDQKEHSYYVQAYDAVGNAADVQRRTGIKFDFAEPTISITGAPEREEGKTIAMANSALTLTVTANDDRKLAATPVVFTIKKDKVEQALVSASTAVMSNENRTAVYTIVFDKTDGTLDGTWTVEATVTDEVGRKKENVKLCEFMLDTQIPAIDENSLKLYNNNNDALGGGKWYRNNTLDVKGDYTDNASGVSKIYYWVTRESVDTSTLSTATAKSLSITNNPIGSATSGTFTADAVGTFEAGQGNYVYFMAEDAAGNKSAVTTQKQVLIDSTSPSAELNTTKTNEYNYRTLTNDSEKLVFKGTATDTGNASGVKKFKLWLSTYVSLEVEATDTDATDWVEVTDKGKIKLGTQTYDAENGRNTRDWEAEIFAGALNGASDSTPLPLKYIVTDFADNPSSETLATYITIDKTAPKPEIKSVSTLVDGKYVNKNFTVNGTNSDNQTIEKLVLKYKIASGDWQEFSGSVQDVDGTYVWQESGTGGIIVEGNKSSWSVKIDSMKAFGDIGDVQGKEITLVAVSTDEAGNTSEDTRTQAQTKFTVDQNTDRPVIVLSTSIAEKDAKKFVNSDTLEGIVTDDDGTITGIWITTTDTTFTEATSGTSLDVNSWSYDLSDDGNKTLYFYVRDAENGEFSYKYDGEDDEFGKLRFKESRTAETTVTLPSPYEFVKDTAAPTINDGKTIYGASNTEATLLNALYLGGTKRNTGKFVFSAKDPNGVASMSVVITNSTTEAEIGKYTTLATAPDGYTTAGTFTETTNDSTDAKWEIPFTSVNFDKEHWTSGLYSFKVSATDTSGAKREKEDIQVKVDFAAPTVGVEVTPSETIITSATVSISISDTVDGFAGAGLTGVEHSWAIPKKTETESTVAWTKINNTTSFSKEFAWEDVSKYSNTEYATYNETTKLWEVPIWFKVVDELGNSETVKKTLTIDKESSYAEAEINSPEDGTKVGSTTKLSGIASISGNSGTGAVGIASIKEVRIQIDANGNGEYDENDFAILSGNATASHISDEKNLKSSNSKWKLWAETKSKYANSETTQNRMQGSASDWYVLADVNGTNWGLTVPTNLFAYCYNGEGRPHVKYRVKALGQMNKNKEGTDGLFAMKDYNASGTEGADHIRPWITDDEPPVLATGVDEREIVIDSQAPQIKDIYLVQYTDNDPKKAVSKSRAYTKNMYIGPGQWYITANLEDETALDSYTLSEISNTTGFTFTDVSEEDLSISDDVKIRAIKPTQITGSSTASGKLELELGVVDNSAKTGQETITINIDVAAPTIPTDSNGLILYNTNNKQLGSDFVIENSDGTFRLGNTFNDYEKNLQDEGGSDIAYVAFWFERQPQSTGIKRVFNPMIAHGEKVGDVYQNQTELTNTETANKVFINDDGLAVMHITGLTRSSDTTITLPSLDSSITQNIRYGGLVQIGGSYVLINKVDGNVLTLNEAADVEFTDAYFVFAQVVNDMSNGADTYGDVGATDGDGMTENLMLKTYNSGSGWWWYGEIDSANIPDGPIIVHVTAIDGAGNVSKAQVSTKIANNRPRITRVMVASDWNNNGNYDVREGKVKNETVTVDNISNTTTAEIATPSGTEFGEFVYYSTISGKYSNALVGLSDVTVKADSGKIFVVPNKLCIIPQFTGGNNDSIKYTWNVVTSNEVTDADKVKYFEAYTTVTTSATPTALVEVKNSITGDTNSKLTSNAEDNNFVANNLQYKGGIELTVAQLETYDDGKKPVKCLAFTFWDATDETTQGVDSLNALLKIPVVLNVKDTTKPHAKIKPFYWTGNKNNSVYQEDNGGIKGHIELEDDLSSDLKTEFSDTTGNEKPKVSGQIIVRGTVYDDVQLDSIWVEMDSVNSGAYPAKVLNYNNGTWESLNVGTTTEFGIKMVSAEAEDITADQTGHLVSYKIVINTESLNDGKNRIYVGKDKAIRVFAQDWKLNRSQGDDGVDKYFNGTFAGTQTKVNMVEDDKGNLVDDESLWTDYYNVDVVPYVTGITTSLSTLDESYPTAHTRSALGRYTVRDNETITLEGYNLAQGATVSDGTNSATLGGGNTLEIGELKSGKISVTVNGIPAVNNLNDNDAKGDYAKTVSEKVGDKDIYDNYYNRQPNGYNNNRLTDDLEFAVWQFNSEAVKPKSGMAIQPIMKINPTRGVIGFAYVDGPLWFSMPYGYGLTDERSTTHDRWIGSFDFFTSVGMTFDDDGYAWAVAAGGDINSSMADTYSLASSRWGTSNLGTNGAIDGGNLIHMDQIGTNENGGTFLKQRFKSSTLTTATHGTQTNIYLAYYDGMADEIRFKAGKYTSGNTRDNFSSINNKYFKNNSGNGLVARRNSETQAIAKGKSGTRGAGQYVCLGVVPGNSADNDVVVAVWWDAGARKMRYAYNTTPLTDRAGNTDGNGWTTADVFSGRQSRAGEYCQIAVDSKGGIHIAAYDSQNLDVVYAYAPSYSGPFSTCTVDSSGVVGEKLTLDVALDATNGNAIPYIGYYATSSVRPKYAYKVLTTESAPSGAESDKVTGDWESIVVPTASTINHEANGQHNKINIGVWKDAGVLKNSVEEPSNATTSTGTTGNYYVNGDNKGDNTYGYVWGNGTKNAVLGYAIEVGTDGYLETAQMK